MRYSATIKRREERIAFVLKYRDEIERLITSGRPLACKGFAEKAREELGYSAKTVYVDIWSSIKRTHSKIKLSEDKL